MVYSITVICPQYIIPHTLSKMSFHFSLPTKEEGFHQTIYRDRKWRSWNLKEKGKSDHLCWAKACLEGDKVRTFSSWSCVQPPGVQGKELFTEACSAGQVLQALAKFCVTRIGNLAIAHKHPLCWICLCCSKFMYG